MLLAVLSYLATTFRLAELVFAAIVAGITGNHLQANRGQPSWRLARFIFTEVIAGLSILWSLFWILPFYHKNSRWEADIGLSVCWFGAFGLLVDWIHGACGDTFDWSDIGFRGSGNDCGTWTADEAFTFVVGFCWIASALINWLRSRRGIDDFTLQWPWRRERGRRQGRRRQHQYD